MTRRIERLIGLSPRASSLLSIIDQSIGIAKPLAELAELDEPGIVPYIVGLPFVGPTDERYAAAMVIHRALSAATPSQLLQVDEACRSHRWSLAASAKAWRGLSPRALAAWGADDPGAQAVLIAASFHQDGYVREAAVARLAQWTIDVSAGRELGALLIRANDWVPVVAEHATDTLARRVTPAYASAWMAALPLLRRLDRGTRHGGGDLADRVSSMLRAPEQREMLLRALSSSNPTDRREAMRLIHDAPWVYGNSAYIADLALADVDPVVRTSGIELACAHLAGGELDAILTRGFTDPHPAVRRRVVDVSSKREVLAIPLLERALLDQSASIRHFARYSLRRISWAASFSGIYRDVIASARIAREMAAAVRGLGETGESADVGVVRPLLGHARISVRVAAVRALTSLDASRTTAARFSALADPSPRVVRAAYESLRSDAIAIGAPALRRAIHGLPFTHGRRRALALAAELPRWDGIAVLVDAAGAADPAVAEVAEVHVARWLDRANRGFVPPRSHQLEALRHAVTSCGESLSVGRRDELRRVIAEWPATE